jgi:periplasmic copper chaperone A
METTTHRLWPSNPVGGRAPSRFIALTALALLGGGVLPAAAAGVTIVKPWMRLIIKERPAAGYFTLRNDTDAAVTLTGASSSACGMVMLHQTKEENGVAKMLPVKKVVVAAHRSVRFAPGGYHLMCMKPQAAMVADRSVPVTLKFVDGKTLTAQFPVKGPGGR